MALEVARQVRRADRSSRRARITRDWLRVGISRYAARRRDIPAIAIVLRAGADRYRRKCSDGDHKPTNDPTCHYDEIGVRAADSISPMGQQAVGKKW